MQNNVTRGLINSLGIGIYTLLVSVLLNNSERLVGKLDNIWGGLVFLLVFIVSALVVGYLLIAKPIMLYIDSQKKEAVGLLTWNLVWLAAVTVVIFIILAIIK